MYITYCLLLHVNFLFLITTIKISGSMIFKKVEWLTRKGTGLKCNPRVLGSNTSPSHPPWVGLAWMFPGTAQLMPVAVPLFTVNFAHLHCNKI